MPRVEIPHEQSRFLAAALHSSDMAAVELMRQMTDDERKSVAGMLDSTRQAVAALQQSVKARLSKEAAEAEKAAD